MATISGNNTGSTKLSTIVKLNSTAVPLSADTVVTISGNTTRTVTSSTFVVGESAAMYMRAKNIVFTAEGLKPNTRYYPFFDKVHVGGFCSTVSGSSSSPIITNSLGNVTGNFFLPSNTFTAGTHVFELVDNVRTDSNNVTVADPLYGSAEAVYEANGILKLVQTQVTEATSTTSPQLFNNASLNSLVPTPAPNSCEEWQFTYEVGHSETGSLSAITSLVAAPDVSTIAFPDGTVPLSIVYLGVTPSGNQFSHKYSFTVSTKRKVTVSQVLRSDMPRADLTTFRPSGLAASDTVTILSSWVRIKTGVACPVEYARQVPPARVDPLAQSFYIDGKRHPQGVFTTSVDVFFKTVDKSMAVVLELREMSNGLPAPTILPGGVSIVPGYATSQSADATLSTSFRFDHPIYLRPNTEYCFVVKSTSLGYNAWCSRLGQKDVTTGKIIDTQPFSGTLFKSENDSTWIPDSYEDMKFNLKIAQFQTTLSGGSQLIGNLVFNPQKALGPTFTASTLAANHQYTIATVGTTDFTLIGAPRNTVGTVFVATGSTTGTGTAVAGSRQYYASGRTLPLAHMSTTRNTDTVRIRVPMHGLTDNDKVLITNIVEPSTSSSLNNIDYNALQNTFSVTVIDEDYIDIHVLGEVADRSGSIVAFDAVHAIDTNPPVTVSGTTFVETPTVFNTTELSPSTWPSKQTTVAPTPPTLQISGTFTIYTNTISNEVLIDYMGTELENTRIDESINMLTASYGQTSSIDIDKDGDFHKFDEPRMLASPLNEAFRSVGQSLTANLKLTSTNKDISPVVDMSGMSLLVRTYKIDNQNDEITDLLNTPGATEADFNDVTLNSEITSGRGLAAAKYKGVVVRADDFYNQLVLFVNGNCPSPAALDVYIRTSADAATHIDRNWTWVPLNGKFGTVFPVSANNKIINEWMYVFNSSEFFNIYDVKIVMRSTNSSIVPKIYGIRAIAEKV